MYIFQQGGGGATLEERLFTADINVDRWGPQWVLALLMKYKEMNKGGHGHIVFQQLSSK